tara:strand:- start:115 stop:303 length:189 start_codon:yes stop_codon:yes gene_type:complete
MASLHLQALHWTTNGELDPIDQLTVLNSLIPQCIATTQLELIRSVERLAVPVSEVTLQVSVS